MTQPSKLTHGEWVHLAAIYSYSQHGAVWAEMMQPYRKGVMASLVRKGLVLSATQSERVRGERRVNWSIYKISGAGRARLQEGSRNVHGLR